MVYNTASLVVVARASLSLARSMESASLSVAGLPTDPESLVARTMEALAQE